MTEWWQNLPLSLDPTAITVGSFVIRWYAIAFIAGWAAAYFYAAHRCGGTAYGLRRADIDDIFAVAIASALVGGRLGYAAIYDPSLLADPIRLVSPFGSDGSWRGIAGMSFFGGAAGVAVGVIGLAWRRGWDTVAVADSIIPSAAIAIFFGRIGNFLNVELPGRVTDVAWGMRFPIDEGELRHPSTLYEAAGEGIALFIILRFLAAKRPWPGVVMAVFFLAYGAIRFSLEFFRAPDPGSALFFGWMTTGQSFAAMTFVASAAFLVFRFRAHRAILEVRGEKS